MTKEPKYYRARIKAINELISQIPVSDEKNNDRVLLRNGFIPEKLKSQFEKTLSDFEKEENNPPLSFVELCSFNTWFAMHPEKVAGIEVVTTSREFPIMIKGSKDEIIEAISRGLSDKQDKRIRIVKVQAESKLKLLAFT
jgi:hypothetical protein